VFFSAPIVPSASFGKSSGKPRMIVYNGCCTTWEAGAYVTLSYEPIAEFMVVTGFPFNVQSSHPKLMRNHITRHTKYRDFGEAWYKICSSSEGQDQYSRCNIIGTYSWFSYRDSYKWHIKIGLEYNHPALKQRLVTEEATVIAKNIPHIGVMQDESTLGVAMVIFHDYICVYLEGDQSCESTDAQIRDGFLGTT